MEVAFPEERPASSAPEGSAGTVLYDGTCGICSRWVPATEPVLRRLGLSIATLQSFDLAGRPGLSREQLERDITLVFPDGRILRGADVYRWVLRRLWWAYPIYLMSILPGGRTIFDRTYRGFARNRHRFSQACGLARPDRKRDRNG